MNTAANEIFADATPSTDWVECKNGPWCPTLSHGGYTAYRIWFHEDGFRKYQRHEWKHADGSTELEEWIRA